MWSYLEHVSSLLEGLTKTLKGLPSDQMVKAKHLLTTQSVEHTIKPIATTQEISSVTNEKKEIAPGILLYVIEGILPMLKVYKKLLNVCTYFKFRTQTFYSTYFHPFNKSCEKITKDSTNEMALEKEIQISAAIASGLLV